MTEFPQSNEDKNFIVRHRSLWSVTANRRYKQSLIWNNVAPSRAQIYNYNIYRIWLDYYPTFIDSIILQVVVRHWIASNVIVGSASRVFFVSQRTVSHNNGHKGTHIFVVTIGQGSMVSFDAILQSSPAITATIIYMLSSVSNGQQSITSRSVMLSSVAQIFR